MTTVGRMGGSVSSVGMGQQWGGQAGQRGINIREVLKNARQMMVNEEQREKIQSVLSVPSPKQDEVGKKTGALTQIVGHEGYYCCLCKTSFGNDDDIKADDKWVYYPVCYVMSHVSCLKFKPCM